MLSSSRWSVSRQQHDHRATHAVGVFEHADGAGGDLRRVIVEHRAGRLAHPLEIDRIGGPNDRLDRGAIGQRPPAGSWVGQFDRRARPGRARPRRAIRRRARDSRGSGPYGSGRRGAGATRSIQPSVLARWLWVGCGARRKQSTIHSSTPASAAKAASSSSVTSVEYAIGPMRKPKVVLNPWSCANGTTGTPPIANGPAISFGVRASACKSGRARDGGVQRIAEAAADLRPGSWRRPRAGSPPPSAGSAGGCRRCRADGRRAHGSSAPRRAASPARRSIARADRARCRSGSRPRRFRPAARPGGAGCAGRPGRIRPNSGRSPAPRSTRRSRAS